LGDESAHAQSVLHFKTEGLVEGSHPGIGGADLRVNFSFMTLEGALWGGLFGKIVFHNSINAFRSVFLNLRISMAFTIIASVLLLGGMSSTQSEILRL